MSDASKRYARVNELFQAAVDLPAAERATLLEHKCAGDDSLRREVESFLAADAQSDDFIEEPILSFPANLLIEEDEGSFLGREIGPYRITREIGRGGLGAVYLAARADEEYRKEVAIKLIRRGLDTDDILRRFRNERQILAQLDHPNIARLLDGGTTADGLPYFVMEYVQGEPIDRYCTERELTVENRLKLFRKVCAAVTYAHQNLVIHRDLKPSNILVTADGEPKLLDFGIAKLVTVEDTALSMTMPAERVMTRDYASPEQIRGEKITTASDIYSLGALLYELLSGARPYRLKTGTTDEVFRAITEQEPQRPSTAAASLNRDSKVANQRSLKGDLDNITLMALRKEPERRYASVEHFAEDIRRHQARLPVKARQSTFSYRAQRFVQRNKIGVAAALIVFLTLVGGIIVTLVQAEHVVVERNHARREAAKASRINTFLQQVLAFSDPSWLSSNPNRDREATVSEALETAGRRAETELADQPEVAAAVHFTIGWTYKALGKLDKAEPHLRAALDIRRRVLGSDDQDTAQSLVGFGELLVMRGDNQAAEAMTRDALGIYRRAQARGEADAKWFAVALSNLSFIVQLTKGQDPLCEDLIREAIAVSAGLTGTERAPIPVFYSNLGNMRGERGDLDGAILYTGLAIEEQRRLPGDAHQGMAMFLNNLGVCLMTKGEHAKAERHFREAIEIAVKTVGENHPTTALWRTNLSTLYLRRGDYQCAYEEALRATEIQQRSLPEGHVDFQRAWVALGRALSYKGELTEGENYLRRAVERAEAKLPSGNRYIAVAQGALGENLLMQRRFAEAEELLQISYRELRSRLGEAHPQTIRAAEQVRKLERARTE
jgi:serine/threonine-protein kinase